MAIQNQQDDKQEECHPDTLLEWRDCEKAGHEQGCFVAQCTNCDKQMYDCEEE
jgi:hypothetical protein